MAGYAYLLGPYRISVVILQARRVFFGGGGEQAGGGRTVACEDQIK